MYFWEYFIEHPIISFILLIMLLYPCLFMFLVAINTNKYFKNLNNQQKKYWLIAVFTGTNISLLSVCMVASIFLSIYIRILIYINTHNNKFIGIIFIIITFALIIWLLKSLEFKDKKDTSIIMKLLSLPMDYWEKTLEPIGVDLYFREKKEEEHANET